MKRTREQVSLDVPLRDPPRDAPAGTVKFVVGPLETYQRSVVPFQRPVEVTSFSLDAQRQLHLDDREMKFYFPPDLRDERLCNLNHGYPEAFQKRDETIPEHLDTLLEALRGVRQKAEAVEGVHHGLDVDFITWRGIMTKILCTPYANTSEGDRWVLRAQRKGNCIYLEESKDPQPCREDGVDQGAKRIRSSEGSLAEGSGSSESISTTVAHGTGSQTTPGGPPAKKKNSQHHRMCYWGYRLEAISTLDQHPERTAGKLPQLLAERIHAKVNTNIQYCTVVKTRLGRRSIIMGAEVDCTRDDKVPNDACRNYVELKTNKVLENDRDRRTFERFKLLKIYFQSFLASIPRVIVGFRDMRGQLQDLQEFETLKIPRIVRSKGYWDPCVCINFADRFLGWLQDRVPKDQPTGTTFLLRYEPPFHEITFELGDPGQGFVPDWA